MSTGEVIFGGVGSGLYWMLLFVLLAVFIAGLMVGRTPEYLGKKIEAREIKLVIDRRPGHAAARCCSPPRWRSRATCGRAVDLQPPGPQGFSETLYAYMSQANNNGSAFAGYTGFIQPNAPGNVGSYGITFADLLGGLAMLFARFVPMLPRWRSPARWPASGSRPAGPGTMRTDNPTFVVLLIGVIVARRRADLLPRPPARPDRPGPDRPPLLMMRRDLLTSIIAIVALHACCSASSIRWSSPASARSLFPGNADGSQIEVDGRRSARS